MNVDELAAALHSLLLRTPLFPGKALDVKIIANTRSGGFTRPRAWSQHKANLEALVAEAQALPQRNAPVVMDLRITERPGHAREMARSFVSAREAEGPIEKELVLVSAGGDGTCWEIQTALMEFDQQTRNLAVLLRLPMGTGNDGADGWDLDDALGRLIRPSRVEAQQAIRASIPGVDGPRYAFNIASLGLDAYVVHMTNVLKGHLPGDSYRLWLDVAALFYELAYPIDPMRLEIFGAGGQAETVAAPVYLAALGVSGRRTYGSHTPILPDDRNFIAVRRMRLLRKLAFKARATSGSHLGMPEAIARSAARVRVSYGRKILSQFDGEVLPLGPENFPLTMELTEPAIRVLKYR